MIDHLKKFIKQAIVSLCIASIFSTGLMASMEPIKYDMERRSVSIGSMLSEADFYQLEKNIQTGTIETLENHGEVSLPLSILSNITYVINHAKSVLAFYATEAFDQAVSLPYIRNYGLMRIKSTHNLDMDIKSFESSGELDLIDGRDPTQSRKSPLTWKLKSDRIEHEGAILGDVLLSIQGINHDIAELGGFIAARNVSVSGVRDLKAFIYSGYGIEDKDSSIDDGNFTYTYTTGRACEGETDPASIVFNHESFRPLVRGAIFSSKKATFNYTHETIPTHLDQTFAPMIAAYLNVSGADVHINSTKETKLILTREAEVPEYSDSDIAVLKTLLEHTTLSQLSLKWSTFTFQTKSTSLIGQDGLSFSFLNKTGDVCIEQKYDVSGKINTHNLSTLLIDEHADVVYGSDSVIDAKKLVIHGGFTAFEEKDAPKLSLSTTAHINVGPHGEFKAHTLITDNASGTKRVHSNLGDFHVDTLIQKSDTFYLENHGTTTVSQVQGMDYSFHVLNNNGHVTTSSPTFLTYEQAYLEELAQAHIPHKETGPARIEGYVETSHKKGIHVDVNNTISTPIDWHQHIVSKTGEINFKASKRLTVGGKSALFAHKKIKLDIPGLNLEKNARIIAQESIKLIGKSHEKHVLDGQLISHFLWIKGHSVSGSGLLDSPSVIFKANVLDTKHFKWNSLAYLNIECNERLRLAGGNIRKENPLHHMAVKRFELDDMLIVSGKGSVAIETPLSANKGVSLRLNGNNNQELTIDSDRITSDNGFVHLVAPNIGFDSRKIHVRAAKGIYVDSKAGKSPELIIPHHVSLIVSDRAGLIEFSHDKKLSVNGATHSHALRLVSGGDLVVNSNDLKMKRIELKAPNGRTDAITGINAKELLVHSQTLTAYDITADVSRIETKFASLERMCFDSAEAYSKIDVLHIRDANLLGNHLFAGDTHHIQNVDSSQADVAYTATNTQVKGTSRAKRIAITSSNATIEGNLKAETLTLPEHAEKLALIGDILTEQAHIRANARHMRIDGRIARTDNSSFEGLGLFGLDGFIKLNTHADELDLIFANDADLSHSKLTAKHAVLRAQNVNAEGMSLKADEAIISARRLLNMPGATLKGGTHVITTAKSAYETCDSMEAFENAREDSVSEGSINLKDASVSVQNLDIIGQKAEFDPAHMMTTGTAYIRLTDFGGENKLNDVMHVLNGLKGCDSVVMDARLLPETWHLTGNTILHRNTTMKVRDIRLEPGSITTGQGFLGLHAVNGIFGERAGVRSDSLELKTEKKDIDLTKCTADALTGDEHLEATTGNVLLKSSQGSAAKDITINSGLTTQLTTLTERVGDGDNFADTSIIASVIARNKLAIDAGLNIEFSDVRIRAGKGGIHYHADGNTLDFAVDHVAQYKCVHADGFARGKFTHADVSTHHTEGDFTSTAGGMQHLFAPRIKAKKVVIHGADGIRVYEVHDCLEFESHTKTDDGFWGGKSETHMQSTSAVSKGLTVDAEHARFESMKDIELTNVNIKASKTIIKSMDGIIKLLMGTNYYMSSMTEKNSSALWQGQGYRTEQRNTKSHCSFSGDVELDARRGVLIQSVQGKVIEYLDQIKMVNGELNFDYVEELYKIEEDYKDGPTAALAIIIAIAASICTMGAGAALSGAMVSAGMVTAGGTAAGAVTVLGGAAISSLASQAAVSLVANKGDFGKTINSLSNSSTLKNIGIAMAAAGISSYVGGQIDAASATTSQTAQGAGAVSTTSTQLPHAVFKIDNPSTISGFGNHGLYQARQMVSQAAGSALFGEQTDMKGAFLTAAAATCAAYMANNIGDSSRTGKVSLGEKYLLHTALGFGSGLVVGGDVKSAAASAAGGLISEVVAESMLSTAEKDVTNITRARNPSPTHVRWVHGVAQMAAVGTVFALGGGANEIGIANAAAMNALTYNHGHSVGKLKGVKSAAQTIEEEDLDREIEKEVSLLSSLESEFGEFRCESRRTRAARVASEKCRDTLRTAGEKEKANFKHWDYNPEAQGRSAYFAEQTKIGQDAILKGLTGQTVTEYEKSVRSDYLTHQSAELALDVAFAKAGDIYRGVKRIFTNKTIQLTSAAGVLESGSNLKVNQALNSNKPLTTAANRNRMPLSFGAADTSEGLRQLANRMNGTHGVARFSNGLSVSSTKMNAGGSGRTPTQTALGKIAGETNSSAARFGNVSSMNTGGTSSSKGTVKPNLTIIDKNASNPPKTHEKSIGKQSVTDYNFENPEAYVSRIDPITGKGPMHIDSREFTSGPKTIKGAPRNQKQFWKLWDEKYPGTLSQENLQIIKKGNSPRVDDAWIKKFPEHQCAIGDIIEHHHIQHGYLATPLPASIHRYGDGFEIWHNIGGR